MPDPEAVNTSTKPDKVNGVNLKTDVSVYNRIDGVVTPDRTDFSRIELWIEFKANDSGAPFGDPGDKTAQKRFIEEGSFTPDTEEGRETRGQLVHYAGAHRNVQFRHFSFFVFVQGDQARFLRWDTSATGIAATFDYREDPELMVKFFWRFNHLTPEQRGLDPSVEPAMLPREVNERVRERLDINDENVPLYRYKIPNLDDGYAYASQPKTTNQSLVSCCTSSGAMLWIPNEDARTADQDKTKKEPRSEEQIVYTKDTWRFLPTSADVEVLREDPIYQILYGHDTPRCSRSFGWHCIRPSRKWKYTVCRCFRSLPGESSCRYCDIRHTES